MCEEHAVDRLMALNFSGLVDEVERCLSFKTRNADPLVRPFYSRILYAWHTARGDYRNGRYTLLCSRLLWLIEHHVAALTMYQRARKLAALSSINPAEFISLAEMQLEAYVVSMNALSLVTPKSAWIILPFTPDSNNEVSACLLSFSILPDRTMRQRSRKRRKLSKHIPEDRYSTGKRDAEVVELADIQYEYTLLSAQIELVKRDPQILAAGGKSVCAPLLLDT